MTVKLAPHFQTLPKWASKVAFPSPWVKVMDPGRGIAGRFPGKRIVGRWYVADEGRYIAAGAFGAERYFQMLRGKYEETRGDVAVCEGVNEPGCNTEEQVAQLGAFLGRWIELMHQAGLIVAVPAFSVGHPDRDAILALEDVWDATDYLSMHTYGTRAIWEEWNGYTSMRYRWVAEQISILCGLETPRMLLTEVGIDRGGDGYRKKPGQTRWPEYLDQLAWYDEELQKDAYVEAAFIFTSGATGTWRSFDVGEGEWRDLARGLASGRRGDGSKLAVQG